MSELFWFSMGVMSVMSVIIVRNKWHHKKTYLKPFLNILKHAKEDKLKFKKRLGDVVYFSGYEKLDIIYHLRRDEISVFDKDDCILVAADSVKHVVDEIVKELESKFYNDIYKNITMLNGVVYSNNISEVEGDFNSFKESPQHTVDGEKAEPMFEFVIEDEVEDVPEGEEVDIKMDEILSKLKESGFESLTSEEKEFISDDDNW